MDTKTILYHSKLLRIFFILILFWPVIAITSSIRKALLCQDFAQAESTGDILVAMRSLAKLEREYPQKIEFPRQRELFYRILSQKTTEQDQSDWDIIEPYSHTVWEDFKAKFPQGRATEEDIHRMHKSLERFIHGKSPQAKRLWNAKIFTWFQDQPQIYLSPIARTMRERCAYALLQCSEKEYRTHLLKIAYSMPAILPEICSAFLKYYGQDQDFANLSPQTQKEVGGFFLFVFQNTEQDSAQWRSFLQNIFPRLSQEMQAEKKRIAMLVSQNIDVSIRRHALEFFSYWLETKPEQEVLEAFVNDPDLEIRRKAIEIAIPCQKRQELPFVAAFFWSAFHEKAISIRKTALAAAGQLAFSHPVAWEILEKSVQDSSPIIRETGARAWQEFSLQAVPPELKQNFSSRIAHSLFTLAQDSNPIVKACALTALSESGIDFSHQDQERFFSLAMQAVYDSDAHVCMSIVPVMAKFFVGNANHDEPKNSLLSYKAMKTSTGWVWQYKKSLYLMKSPIPKPCTRFHKIQPTKEQSQKAWQALEILLQKQAPLVQRDVLWALWQFIYDLPSEKQKKIWEFAYKAVENGDPVVRLTGVWILGETFLYSSKDWQTMACKAFQNTLVDPIPEVAQMPAFCLYHILQYNHSHPEDKRNRVYASTILSLLLQASQQKEYKVKKMALAALGRLHYQDLGEREEYVWEILANSLQHPTLSFRLEGIYSIGTFLIQLPAGSPYHKRAWEILYSIFSQKDTVRSIALSFSWISSYDNWPKNDTDQKSIFLFLHQCIQYSAQNKENPVDIAISPKAKISLAVLQCVLAQSYAYSISRKFGMCFPTRCSHPVVPFLQRHSPWKRFVPGSSVLQQIPMDERELKESLYLFSCFSNQEDQNTIVRTALYSGKGKNEK
ncbi:MAG: HEAT repeat domain-containing protein [Candidatus Brocadiae bacterium]|nr:HEAT repeat domain-containing protein [Candidatus Brocadiia bacterium]